MTDIAFPAAADAGFRDRSVGLAIFGAIQILLGIAAAMLAFAVSAAPDPHPSSLLLFGAATLYFFAVGIGSIRARRWARALSVSVSGLWLAVGVLATLVGAIVGESSGLPRVIVGAVIVPLALLLFYRVHDVGVTCDVRDPKTRWTDRVPLSVLALIMVMAFSAVSLIANLGDASSQLPAAFQGAPAGVAVFALAVLFAYVAMQLYRLKQSAWWTTLMLQVVGTVSAAMSLANGSVRNGALWGVMIVAALACIAFLLSIRRYFVGVVPRTRAADTPPHAHATVSTTT